MKTSYLFKHSNYLTRTAIEAEILFAVSSVAERNCKNKIEQSAAQSCLGTFALRVLPFGKTSGVKLLNLLNSLTDRTFENRRGKYKELGKKVPQAYRVYVEDTFLPCDAGDARRFKRRDGAVLLWSTVFRPEAFKVVVRRSGTK